MNQEQQEREWLYWYPRVYAYFFKRVSMQYDVEELTASTMNTVFMAPNITHFKAYMWKVAHNYLVKYINTKNTQPMIVSFDETFMTGATEPSFNLDEAAENTRGQRFDDKLKQMHECIKNQLNESDQKLIELSIYEEKTSNEIGQILDLKPDNVRQKLSRTLRKLRKHCRELWPQNLQTK